MSISHLLKSGTTHSSDHVASEDMKKCDNGNKYEIVMSSPPDTTTQTITCSLPPCFSAFDVAVVGTFGVDYIQLPHSSYTICNIVMEQPAASPKDDKVFVYNSDVVMDEVIADARPQQDIKREKINSRPCSDQKVASVKVVSDCKKPKNVDTSILRLPNSMVRQNPKSHRQWQPPLLVTEPLKVATPVLHLPSSTVIQESHKQPPITHPLIAKQMNDVIKVGGQDNSEKQATAANCQFKCDSKAQLQWKSPLPITKPFTSKQGGDVTKVGNEGKSEKQTAANDMEKQFKSDSKSQRQWNPPPKPLTTKETDAKVVEQGEQTTVGYMETQATTNYNMERQFKCEHKGCEKSFAYQTHLRFHVQHAHMGYSPYICDFEGCGRCFYTEHHLVVHLRTHTEVKPFVCPYEKCKKAFSTTGNLRNHIRTHTGEKPYKCSHKGCNKGFAELSSLKKHELTHTGEKPHPCRFCGRCFSQAGSRNTHERLKHKDVFVSCDTET